MRRRAFLAGSVGLCSISVAGCTAVGGTQRLSLDPFDPGHVIDSEFTTEQRASLEVLREEGVDVTYGYHRFNNAGDSGYVELDDGFYRLTTAETGDRIIRRDFLVAEFDDSEAAMANAVDLEEAYGTTDQDRIREAIDGTLNSGRNFSLYVFRDTDPDSTDLLFDPVYEYVEFVPDSTLGVRRTVHLRITSGTASETEYTTRLEPAGDSVDELAAHADEQGLVSRLEASQLTDEQREVVETAVEETYVEPRPLVGEDDEPFEGVPLEPTRDPETDRLYQVLRYDGEYYRWTATYTDGV